MQDFEQQLTRGTAQWISFFEYEKEHKHCLVGLTHNPDKTKTEKVLEFQSVLTIEWAWFDRNDDCMEGLLGASEVEDGAVLVYMLVTDQRQISLRATSRAIIQVA